MASRAYWPGLRGVRDYAVGRAGLGCGAGLWGCSFHPAHSGQVALYAPKLPHAQATPPQNRQLREHSTPPTSQKAYRNLSSSWLSVVMHIKRLVTGIALALTLATGGVLTPTSAAETLEDEGTSAPLSDESPDEENNSLSEPLIAPDFATENQPTSGGYAAALTSQTCQTQVLDLINKERAKAGVGALSLHSGLNSLSTMWSDWIGTTGEFTHLPIKYGNNGWALWGAVGTGGSKAENIAAGYRSPEAVVSGWMNSAGHRANILNPSFKYMGVGCSYSNLGYGIYWTQQFASQTVTKTSDHQRIPLPTGSLNTTISGTRSVGSTLSFSTGGQFPPNTTLSYQWKADGAAIPGATGSTFTPSSAQLGKIMSIAVTASNDPAFYAPLALPTQADTVPVSIGWVKGADGWYYLKAQDTPAIGWVNTGEYWYYMNSSGLMQTGWQHVGNYWYYLNPTGDMRTGWANLGGIWYYLNPDGSMATGWKQVAGSWYYFRANGAMATHWNLVNQRWYYLGASGTLQTGWNAIGGYWYYMDAGGAMQTGWVSLGGSWYYLLGNGVMASGGPWLIDGKNTWFSPSGIWLR